MKTYSELKQELDQILIKLQSSETELDDAVALHAEGQKILKQLDTYLQKIADTHEVDIKKVG